MELQRQIGRSGIFNGNVIENIYLIHWRGDMIRAMWVCAGTLAMFGGLVSGTRSLMAADWSQWRGPERNGISNEQGLLQSWPEEGPELVWQATEIGDGYSTPAVVGDRLFLLSNEGMDNEFAQARSVADGQEIWSTRLGKVGTNRGPQYPASRSTPTVDNGWLYVLGSDGDLACLEAASGEIRWHKNLRTEFAGKPGSWAYAESPLIDGDVLVCTPGGTEATIVALNKEDGELIWKFASSEGDEAAYASVVPVETRGIKQYVQFLQKGVVGLDAETGKLLWRYERTAEGSPANIPTPLVSGNLIYTAAGRSGGGLIAVKVNQNDVAMEEVYFSPRLPTALGGAVIVNGFLYGTNSQGMMCAEFDTGEVRWQDRAIGAGSICYADGRLYLHGENGEVALVEANSEAYREHGRFTPPNSPDRGRSKAWAYPVIADGRLYIRDLGNLWCFDIRSSAAGK